MSNVRYDRLCRLCLKDSFSLKDIFLDRTASGEPIHKILNYVYDLEVCQDDGLPSKICSPCIWRVVEFMHYKKHVHSAKDELLKNIGSPRHDNDADEFVGEGEEIVPDIRQVPIKIEIEEWEMPAVSKIPQDSDTREENAADEKIVMGDTATEEAPVNDGVDEGSAMQGGLAVWVKTADEDEDEEYAADGHYDAESDDDRADEPRASPEEYFPTRDEETSLQTQPAEGGKRLGRKKVLHKCNVCGKQFRRRDMTLHRWSHTVKKPFKCDKCSKEFMTPYARERHSRVHRNEERMERMRGSGKLFTCPTCGKCYYNQVSYYAHCRIHSGRFSCKTCGKCFSANNSLQIHERIHRNERPFECGVCHKTFTQKSSFNKHALLHSEVKVF